MAGAVYRDPPSAALIASAVTSRNVTTTTTGSAVDMIRGDGRCMMYVDLVATSLTAVTVRVQQSTATNSGMADVPDASVSATTNGIYTVTFDRDKRYLQAVITINGTTAAIGSISFWENLKTF
jgi:hypothetical protein